MHDSSVSHSAAFKNYKHRNYQTMQNKPQEIAPMAFKNDIVEVYTVQMSKWRLVEKMGIKFLDITAKSGIRIFAPDYATVMYFKDGNMSEDDYTDLYFEKMVKSQKQYPNYWNNLNRYPKIAIACYCKPGEFCHRILFVKLMTYYLSIRNVKVISKGEITQIEENNEHAS